METRTRRRSGGSKMDISLARSLFAREDCVSCSGPAPVCNCAAGEQCILSARSCTQCPTVNCIKGASSSSGGVNPGVIAGPIVAVLVIASVALFWYLRRKKGSPVADAVRSSADGKQRRDLARLEELAARARAAEGFQLSQPGSASPFSARSARSGPASAKSRQSQQQQQQATSPRSAATFGFGRGSALPSAPLTAEYKTENTSTRVYGGKSGAIAVDPSWPGGAGGGDPFDDRHSQLSGGTGSSGGTDGTRIIPIQYAPSGGLDGHQGQTPSRATQAARTLDEARQNLFKPNGAPARPARAPGLNLRAPDAQTSNHDALSPSDSQHYHNQPRDSFLSGVSGAPSFLSGTTDLYVDAPKIITSKNVRVGRLQQAEMVQWGGSGAGPAAASGPGSSQGGYEEDDGASSRSQETFGVPRRLTPTHQRYAGDQEGLDDLSPPHGPNGGAGDLRFSMGSLAYRDSMSSMGTSRYLPSSSFHNLSGTAAASHEAELASLPPPRFDAAGGRQSVMSSKSYADSLLGTYPMIPHGSAGPMSSSGSAASGIPTSSSAMTLDNVGGGGAPPASRSSMSPGRSNAPPPSFRPPLNASTPDTAAPLSAPPTAHASTAREAVSTRPRPDTQASVADSFLGSFPFVPPNMDDLATLPSAMLPSAVGQGPETATGRRRPSE